MKLFVALAVLEGASASDLDDADLVRDALDVAVRAGGFSHLETVVARFSPHGVTGTAVVGESHVSIHTWPEEGRAFVDVASCSTRQQVHQAVDALARRFGARVAVLDERELSSDGARAASAATRPSDRG